MEDRLQRVEREIAQLRVDRATDVAVLAALKEDVQDLTKAVTNLNATLNRARGAIWFIGFSGVAVIESVHWIAEHFFGAKK